MTPEEARDLLDNFDRLLPFEAELEIEGAAKDMAAMIAGMREEYAIELQLDPGGQWHQVTGWSHEAPLHDGHTLAPDERIVRRFVTEPEEIS